MPGVGLSTFLFSTENSLSFLLKVAETKILMAGLLCASPVIIFLIHIMYSRLAENKPPQIVTLQSVLAGYLPMGILLWHGAFKNMPAEEGSLAVAAIYAFLVYSAI